MSLTLMSTLAVGILTISSPGPDKNYHVDMTGIDFSTPQAVDQFDARVSRAARRACYGGNVGVRRVTCMRQFRIEAAAALTGHARDQYLASRPQYVTALSRREL